MNENFVMKLDTVVYQTKIPEQTPAPVAVPDVSPPPPAEPPAQPQERLTEK